MKHSLTPLSNAKERTTLVQDFVRRLVEHYNYSSEQIGTGVSLASGIEADIAIWRTVEHKKKSSMPDICVVVICKDEHIKIEADDYLSAYKEAAINTVNFFVCHNLKETKVFLLDSKHPMGGVVRIGDFPKASDIASEEKMDSFISRMRNCTKDALIQALGKCHNIIRNNDKLSPEAAFDEISKVIFIKMMYERKPEGELIYSLDKFLKDEQDYLSKNQKSDYIACLFGEVKSYFINDGLFDRLDQIRIKRSSFTSILKELEVIDFYDMSEDVKGVAFEAFLGKTFRGELGQFFTPRTIVNYMVDVLDIKEGEMVCDPCCGSGGFLIRAFEHVQDFIDNDIHSQIEDVKKSNLTESEKKTQIEDLLSECDKTKPGSRYSKLCRDYFFGVDANIRMARTSKMNMIMHGDGHVGVYQHDGLLDVGKVKKGVFDVILINPPFGVHVDRNTKDEDGHNPFAGYVLKNSAAELLFIERTLNLLKPGGRAGLVLPEGVFTNTQLKNVRRFIEKRAEVLNITSIPSDVFLASGANIKPSLLFIRKYGEDEIKSKAQTRQVSLAKVTDAGITSTGLPSDNSQLLSLMPEIRGWIADKTTPQGDGVRMVDYADMDDWSVLPHFDIKPVEYKDEYNVVRLSEVLSQSNESVMIEDDKMYRRITVKLNNRGITLRDEVLGATIGTRRQAVVREGQFVISKIDGKSGAFAIVPKEVDGAIVTPDFPVFNIDTNRIKPEYLELVLSYPELLSQYKVVSSGSTGRQRLSMQKFLSTKVALPTIEEQSRMLERISSLRARKIELEAQIEDSVDDFYRTLFV